MILTLLQNSSFNSLYHVHLYIVMGVGGGVEGAERILKETFLPLSKKLSDLIRDKLLL